MESEVRKDCSTCAHLDDAFSSDCATCAWFQNWEPMDPGQQREPVEGYRVAEARKFDQEKPPLDLIPRSAEEAEARVLGLGAKKYDKHNWRHGMDWSRLGAAAKRHLIAWLDGEDNDPETGESHLAHLRCCAGFLIEYQAYGIGTDDRYKRV